MSEDILALINALTEKPFRAVATTETATAVFADPQMIAYAVALLCVPGEVYELRALDADIGTKKVFKTTLSGYYVDHQAMVDDAVKMAAYRPPGVFVTVNPAKPELLARRSNRFDEKVKDTTGDDDIAHRYILPIDFDAVRPSGISSSDREHELALERAPKCRAYLTELGWPEPVYADSGNGGHLLYRIDLVNDADALTLVKGVLAALAVEFSDAAVKVDGTVSNAARIFKLYGTPVRKGDSTAERPHRLSRILEAPDELTTVSGELLAALAAKAPVPAEPSKPKTKKSGKHDGPFDMASYIKLHELDVLREEAHEGGTRWILKSCPFNPEHTGTSCALFLNADGGPGFKCHHDSCKENHIKELFKLLKPARSLPENDLHFPTMWEGVQALEDYGFVVVRNPPGVYDPRTRKVVTVRQAIEVSCAGWRYLGEDSRGKETWISAAKAWLENQVMQPKTVNKTRVIPGTDNGTIVNTPDYGDVVSSWPKPVIEPIPPDLDENGKDRDPDALWWWDVLLMQACQNLPLPHITDARSAEGKKIVEDNPEMLALMFNPVRPTGEGEQADLNRELFDDRTINADILEQLLGWPLAHPEDFVVHIMPYIQSFTRGTGKGMLFETIAMLYHPDMVADIHGPALQGQFDGFAKDRMLVHIDEASGDENKSVMQKIKALITNRQLELNTKYGAFSKGDIGANLVTSANHMMSLDAGVEERRIMLLCTTAWPLEAIPGCHPLEIIEARKHTLGKLLWHLLHRKYYKKVVKGDARKTLAFFAHQSRSGGSGKQDFANAIVTGEFPVHTTLNPDTKQPWPLADIYHYSDIKEAARRWDVEHRLNEGSTTTPDWSLSNAFGDTHGGRALKTTKVDGESFYLFAVRDANGWGSKTGRDRVTEYLRGGGRGGSGNPNGAKDGKKY